MDDSLVQAVRIVGMLAEAVALSLRERTRFGRPLASTSLNRREDPRNARVVKSARVLILASRTADSLQLMQAVSDRAARGPCEFTLLVPTSPRGCIASSIPRTTVPARRKR
jgi:hypothetical protein